MAERSYAHHSGDWWSPGSGWSWSGWPEGGWNFERPGEEIVGGPGADRLVGGRGNDTLRGSIDDVLVDGRGGYDTARIAGSDGDDDLNLARNLAVDDPSLYVFSDGLYGPERVEIRGVERLEILGLGGDDSLVVGSSVFEEEIRVLGGTASVDAPEVVVFRGGSGNDLLDGSQAMGPLVGRGGTGDDTLIGGAGSDDLRGGRGADLLAGNDGADTLSGGRGDDVLIGGGGADALRGGPGADVFFFGDLADVQIEDGASDRIVDFAPGEDLIDLGGIDAVPGGDVDAFRFLGNISPDFQILMSGDLYFDPEDQALKGFVGDFVSYSPNFEIELPGVEALDEGDLILESPAAPPSGLPDPEPLPSVPTIELTFVSADTELSNTLGVLVRDEAGGFTGEAGILFPETSEEALDPGATNAVFGYFPGDVNFFLVRDGANLGLDWAAGEVRIEDGALVFTGPDGASTVLDDDQVNFDFEEGTLRPDDDPLLLAWEDGVLGEPSYDGDFDDAVFRIAYPGSSGDDAPLLGEPLGTGFDLG